MKPSVLIFILSGSILLLFGNGYSLDLNDQLDKFSLANYSFPFVKKKRNDHIKFVSHCKIPVSYFWMKCICPCEFIDTLNQNPISTSRQNIASNNCYGFIDEVRECMISLLRHLTIGNKTDCDITITCNPKLLSAFYLHRGVKPVWVTEDGLNSTSEILINTINDATHEGLDSENYHQKDILKLVSDIKLSIMSHTPEPAILAELDLLLTDAFFSFGFHLSEGMVDPYSNKLNWYIKVSV
jgi:hypothetical protein